MIIHILEKLQGQLICHILACHFLRLKSRNTWIMIRFLFICGVLLLCSCEEEISSSVELVKLPNGSIVYSVRGYLSSEEFEFQSTNDKIKSKKLVFRPIFDFHIYNIFLECHDDEIVFVYPNGIENDYIAYYNVINGRPQHDTVRAGKEYLPQILADSIDGKRIKIKFGDKSIYRSWVDSNGFEQFENNYKIFDSVKGVVFNNRGIIFSSDSLNRDKPINCK